MTREQDLKAVVGENEKIIWEGRPNKKCFILESIFNPLLPFALIWAAFDIFFLSQSLSDRTGFIIVPFLLLHMMPVWIYLFGVIFSIRKYNNTYYIITDMGVYISGGVFSYTYDMKPFAELSTVSMHRGIIDQWTKVGDVIFNENYRAVSRDRNGFSFAINNIEDYQEVYKLVKKMQRDVHADTMYPNDLRPNENHGYQTQYVDQKNETQQKE